ncbi:MAG: hypothetical protein H0T68_13830, partial [Gemmatimonadales bacterium]|nr:hypothetical protein [Gemmatimonadales bacterium]
MTTDDRAYCWGRNPYGGLGDGTTEEHHTPTPVAGGLSFRRVSVGDGYTCGVTTGNRAYCWGANTFGQLGDGTATHRSSPVAAAAARRFRQVSPGS